MSHRCHVNTPFICGKQRRWLSFWWPILFAQHTGEAGWRFQTFHVRLPMWDKAIYSGRKKPRYSVYRVFIKKEVADSCYVLQQASALLLIEDERSTVDQGRRSRGGFSPPTFEEDDILFCFSICSYSRKYIRVFARWWLVFKLLLLD